MGRHDDEQVGRVLTRRQAVSLAGLPALSSLAGCSDALDTGSDTTDGTSTDGTTTTLTSESETSPSTTTTTGTTTVSDVCVVKPELNPGPFYVEEGLERADIRTDTTTGEQQDGVHLDLKFNVYELNDGCSPLDGAVVDIWHANAAGTYSAVESEETADQDFLRGYQHTDEVGVASFTTIYPGWYPGRTAHIHVRIYAPTGSGDTYEFTSQLFFDDELTTRVYQREPYQERGGRDTTNANDPVYRERHESLKLDVRETDAGYETTFDVALATE